MSSSKRRPALGRGLGALLPGAAAPKPGPPASPPDGDAPTPASTASGEGLRIVSIEALSPGPEQPRKRFEPNALAELARSIETQGIIQPIVVSPLPRVPGQPPGQPRRYVIVAGERRWRAAQQAGLHEVPVVVREVDDDERLELALVENIQRADLNPIEEARAYAQLLQLRGWTQDDLAGRVGKDRSTIANALRLLRLPEKVQEMVREGQLSMGHARTLLGLEHEADIVSLAREVARTSMSVRATEQAVRKHNTTPRPPTEADDESQRRKIIVKELEDRLRRRLGVRVKLRPKGKGKSAGTLEIPYGSLDELDRVLHVILREPAG
ncbi:ParB/RepB/Spo0J family partition protein [Paraliomyxa miuraensis]|uniref:ParB/RepB/Spo0J family partition protein n=1 Tax=Paraliomyxa miuraensis TaxID=376150 RepID=UPI0022507836|nr:ParB/RepB/Spo0J family partition protein [Paraliomyxa miuraensis]MCX4242362.1 ParB/RepB/Spo0J family partition protein [Paraliomyxa miuraensis]